MARECGTPISSSTRSMAKNTASILPDTTDNSRPSPYTEQVRLSDRPVSLVFRLS